MTFSATWARCDDYFRMLRKTLARYSDLVSRSTIEDKTLNNAKIWRAKEFEQCAQREREHALAQRESVISWLKHGGEVAQEEELEEQLSRCHPNTCDWLIGNAKIKDWLRDSRDYKTLWLKGKPGSGNLFQPYFAIALLLATSSTNTLGQAKQSFART